MKRRSLLALFPRRPLFRRFWIVLFVGVLHRPLAEAWNLKTLEHAKSFSVPDESFKDPYFFTAYGAVMGFKSELRLWKAKYREYVKLEMPHLFSSGYVDPLLHAENRPADLVLILPGIATAARTPLMARALDAFSNRGFHTLVLFNSWSDSYLKLGPKHLPGDLIAEADVVLEVLRAAVRKIGAHKVRRIHVYGESYGAFTTAIVATRDRQSREPVISGSVTLASPPLSFVQAAKNLDESISQAGQVTVDSLRFKFLKLFWDLHVSSISDSAETSLKSELKPMIAVGVFRKHLEGALSLLKGQKRVPDPVDGFGDYFQFVHKQVASGASSREPRYELSTWLEKMRALKVPYRVVTSADEFLNIGVEWPAEERASNRLLILPWGGHLGYQGMKWWEKFLDLSFGPRVAGAEPPIYIGNF